MTLYCTRDKKEKFQRNKNEKKKRYLRKPEWPSNVKNTLKSIYTLRNFVLRTLSKFRTVQVSYNTRDFSPSTVVLYRNNNDNNNITCSGYDI